MQPSLKGFSKSKVGIYVHFPWCLEKCPYCDFLSVTVKGAEANVDRARALIPHERYADAILAELELRLRHLNLQDAEIDTVFFGGGTPSLWAPTSLARVLAGLRQSLPLSEACEVSVECNPTSVSEKHFEELLVAGATRVSVGVQATDNERLGFLGRLHDDAGGLRALRQARAAGVPRISGDLIFGVFRQSPEAAVIDAERVTDAGVSHISCYALTIEDNTRFGALHRAGRLPLLEDELVARSFEAVSSVLQGRGFAHYEVSNFAQPGEESRHNLGYWLGHDYLGLGTGAFGTVTLPEGRLRYRNLLSPERYMETFLSDGRLAQGASLDPFSEPTSERELLPPATSLAEAIMLGLRLAQGIEPTRLAERFDTPFWTEERAKSFSRLLDQGLLVSDASAPSEAKRVSIPHRHWLLADGIIARLL